VSEVIEKPKPKLVVDTNVLITTLNRKNPEFAIYTAFERKSFESNFHRSEIPKTQYYPSQELRNIYAEVDILTV
jgi:hypothetical protein